MKKMDLPSFGGSPFWHSAAGLSENHFHWIHSYIHLTALMYSDLCFQEQRPSIYDLPMNLSSDLKEINPSGHNE